MRAITSQLKNTHFRLIVLLVSFGLVTVAITGAYIYYNRTIVQPSNTNRMISADYMTYDSLSALVKDSKAIFTGSTLSHTQFVDKTTGMPVQKFKVKVLKRYKNSSLTDTVIVNQLGGEKDGSRYTIEGATPLQDNTTYIFFATGHDNQFTPLAGGNAFGTINGETVTLSHGTGIKDETFDKATLEQITQQ